MCFGVLTWLRASQRILHAVLALLVLLGTQPCHFGQRQIHQALEQLRVLPERIEGAIKYCLVFMAVDQHGGERGMHARALIHAGDGERL